ncbi:hypothetical protein [Streptomyces manipurensis]|uniref:hypothetical protein n=1 Tax=Streptomyces manipurensis TaxID=1077945 RepID=UPI003C6FD88A
MTKDPPAVAGGSFARPPAPPTPGPAAGYEMRSAAHHALIATAVRPGSRCPVAFFALPERGGREGHADHTTVARV